MNALYVTVSIPLLLLLAGFNHAHGLTTFGKTSNNNNQQPLQPPGSDLCLFYRIAKPCNNHTVCKGIVGASCVQDPKDHAKKSCLCGDNQPPINGACSATYRGASHLCSETSQCVEGAVCMHMGKNPGPNTEKVCKCKEGLTEMNNTCNGGTPTSVLSSLIILLAITRTILY